MIRNTAEFDQRIADWLEADPSVAPPDVMSTVVAALPSISQARRGLLAPRRFTFMQSYMRLAAVAALVAVAGVGAIYLGGGDRSPGASPTPTAVPSAGLPTATTAPTGRSALMEIQGDSASWTATVPPGWSPAGGWFMTPSQGTAGPTGISVTATGAVNVPFDPCDGVGKVSEATTPGDVVAELEGRHDLIKSTAIQSSLGGYSGLQLDVEVPADLSACDLYIIFSEPDGSGFFAQGPSNRMKIWILDVDGRPVVFFIEHFAGTPAADLAAAQQIVDSIVITP